MLEARYRDVFSASLPERVLRRSARHGKLRRISGHGKCVKVKTVSPALSSLLALAEDV